MTVEEVILLMAASNLVGIVVAFVAVWLVMRVFARFTK